MFPIGGWQKPQPTQSCKNPSSRPTPLFPFGRHEQSFVASTGAFCFASQVFALLPPLPPFRGETGGRPLYTGRRREGGEALLPSFVVVVCPAPLHLHLLRSKTLFEQPPCRRSPSPALYKPSSVLRPPAFGRGGHSEKKGRERRPAGAYVGNMEAKKKHGRRLQRPHWRI